MWYGDDGVGVRANPVNWFRMSSEIGQGIDTMPSDNVVVNNNPVEQRFEVEADGQLAMIAYTQRGNTIVFTHTEVPEALRGQGIAEKMAHAALEHARTHQLHVMPICSFVAGYIQRHPEYQSLVRST